MSELIIRTSDEYCISLPVTTILKPNIESERIQGRVVIKVSFDKGLPFSVKFNLDNIKENAIFIKLFSEYLENVIIIDKIIFTGNIYCEFDRCIITNLELSKDNITIQISFDRFIFPQKRIEIIRC